MLAKRPFQWKAPAVAAINLLCGSEWLHCVAEFLGAARGSEGKLNQEETLALYAKGKADWNAWAEALLTERRILMEAGDWQEVPQRRRSDWHVGKNEKTQQWLDAASSDFSGHTFETMVDFRGFIFPGDTDFGSPLAFQIKKRDSTRFKKTVLFDCAEFHGIAWFDKVIFSEDSGFDDAIFRKKARFVQTVFEYFAAFRRAKFEEVADFRAIHSKGVFDLWEARFALPPDFVQAHFDEAPVLDGVVVPLPRFFANRRRFSPARYRALRRLAVQGHDHDNERLFLKGEIRARRQTRDMSWHAAFWFGIGYDVLSDFVQVSRMPGWLEAAT